MNISFEANDKVNGLMTITIEKEDYAADVEKQLKDFRKKANMPGFRPGQVPMGMVHKTNISKDEFSFSFLFFFF